MAKKKELKILTTFKILLDSLKLYIQNMDKFLRYMTFPVLGQAVGVALILIVVHLYAKHIDKIVSINPIFDNIPLMLIILLLLITPGFMLFFAGFWKYLVAYGALNSMANNLTSGAKLEDLKIHNDTVTRRTATFVCLVFFLSVIYVICAFPLLWLVFLIFGIYSCLVFQVFALEENLNVFEIFKKSFQTVKGNFLKVAFLLLLLYLVSYILIPKIFVLAFNQISIIDYIANPINAFCQNLPISDVQDTIQTFISLANPTAEFTLDINQISKNLATNLVEIIIIGYLLPFRSICCTILYKDLEIKKLKEKKIKEL